MTDDLTTIPQRPATASDLEYIKGDLQFTIFELDGCLGNSLETFPDVDFSRFLPELRTFETTLFQRLEALRKEYDARSERARRAEEEARDEEDARLRLKAHDVGCSFSVMCLIESLQDQVQSLGRRVERLEETLEVEEGRVDPLVIIKRRLARLEQAD